MIRKPFDKRRPVKLVSAVLAGPRCLRERVRLRGLLRQVLRVMDRAERRTALSGQRRPRSRLGYFRDLPGDPLQRRFLGARCRVLASAVFRTTPASNRNESVPS